MLCRPPTFFQLLLLLLSPPLSLLHTTNPTTPPIAPPPPLPSYTHTQAFLYSTPLHAHIVTKTPGVTDDMKTKSVKKVTQITLSQASKVCVQLLVVPLLLLTSSLGYLLLSFGSPLEVTSPFARVWDKQPSVFLMSVAGFMGWWGSTVYMFWASLGCILSRLNSSALAG